MTMSDEKWNVVAVTHDGEKQYAWGFDKATAKSIAQDQRERRVFKRVYIERDKERR